MAPQAIGLVPLWPLTRCALLIGLAGREGGIIVSLKESDLAGEVPLNVLRASEAK